MSVAAPLVLEAVRRGGGDGGTLGGLLVVVAGVLLVGFTVLALVRTHRRRKRVHMAATEAALTEPHLAPDRVEQAGGELFTAAQEAWNAGDRARLAELLAPGLAEEWSRRLDEQERQGVRYHLSHIGKPHTEMMGLVNREGSADDRVTVKVLCNVRPHLIDAQGRKQSPRDAGKLGYETVNEYWTLARREDRWVCVAIESSLEGAHHMKADVVAGARGGHRA